MGDMAIFCNQARLPMEGLGHQPSHKIFDLPFVLPARHAGVNKGGQPMTSTTWDSCMRGNQVLTLLRRPGSRVWMTQRPRLEQNTTEKKNSVRRWRKICSLDKEKRKRTLSYKFDILNDNGKTTTQNTPDP